MKKRIPWKTGLAGLLVLLLCCGCMGAWRERKSGQTQDHLVMYLIGSQGTDHELVMERLNSMLERDLNCSLTVKYISLGEYMTKYPLVLSSGEQVDLIMSANWLNYSGLSRQGVFLPLEEKLPVYCPESSKELDMEMLTGEHADGHLYMLPCNYVEPAAWGVIARKDVMEELGYESIDTMEDYFRFCIDTAQKTEYIDSTSQTLHVQDEVLLYSFGYCPVDGSTGAPYWFNVKRGDETGDYTVYNKAEIPELQAYFQAAQTLFEQGAWSASALSNTDTDRMQEGLSASFLHLPNRWLSIASRNPDAEIGFYLMADPVYVPSEHTYIGMSVPATSRYPEKALQILEFLHQEEAYFDLLTYGIEGIHYTVNEETGEIRLKNQTGYSCENGTWGFRNARFEKKRENAPEGYQKLQETIRQNCYENIFQTFLPDLSGIRTEYASVHEVMEKEYTLMSMGYVDYESGMRKVKAALQRAGNEKCKQEIQRQVDAFAASHRK